MSRILYGGLADALERIFFKKGRDESPRNFVAVSELLLEHGANVTIPNAFKETALDWTLPINGEIASLLHHVGLGQIGHADRTRKGRGDGRGGR